MYEVKCSKKNFDVAVGIRNLGRPVRKFVHFNGQGKCLLDEKDDMDARVLERLKEELKTGAIPGLVIKKITAKKTGGAKK